MKVEGPQAQSVSYHQILFQLTSLCSSQNKRASQNFVRYSIIPKLKHLLSSYPALSLSPTNLSFPRYCWLYSLLPGFSFSISFSLAFLTFQLLSTYYTNVRSRLGVANRGYIRTERLRNTNKQHISGPLFLAPFDQTSWRRVSVRHALRELSSALLYKKKTSLRCKHSTNSVQVYRYIEHRRSVTWSVNTCFSLPLHKPSRNEPSQNHFYGDQIQKKKLTRTMRHTTRREDKCTCVRVCVRTRAEIRGGFIQTTAPYPWSTSLNLSPKNTFEVVKSTVAEDITHDLLRMRYDSITFYGASNLTCHLRWCLCLRMQEI
jgi:hypothetical protein